MSGAHTGVVNSVPTRMEWKMPQVAHKEALSVVQQALACIEEEGRVLSAKQCTHTCCSCYVKP